MTGIHVAWPRPFAKQTVTLQDDFGEHAATVSTAETFCTPATELSPYGL